MAERSLGNDLKSAARSKAVRGITGSLFGSGIVGSALKRSFQRKFAPKTDDQESDVVDALKEQEKVISDNDMTLIRIERIVMNIADNIYNIAGIMNAQVVSMREAERLREQARSRDLAAREEALSESTREIAPTAAGTEISKPEEKKGGIVSSLLGTVGKTKRMFGSFLKKFGVAALAVTGTLAAATMAMAASERSDGGGDGAEVEVEGGTGTSTTPPPVNQDDGSYDAAEAARLSRSTPPPSSSSPATPVQKDETAGQMMSQFSQMVSSAPGGAEASARLAPFTSAMASDNPIASFIAAAQDDAARNPQPQQSTPSTPPAKEPTAVSQPTLSAQTPPPKSTAELIQSTKDNIEGNNKRLGQREAAYQVRVAEIRKRYANEPDKMQESLEREAFGIEEYRKMIRDSNALHEERIKQLEAENTQQPAGSGTPSVSMPPPSSQSSGGGGGGGGASQGGGGGGSSGGGAATPVAPTPSTGNELGNTSAQVAADTRTMGSAQPSTQVVTAESATSSIGGQAPSVLPSPVADRGSLDKNTTFESAM